MRSRTTEFQIKHARRAINKRMDAIRDAACPIKDAALLEFMSLYRDAIAQLDQIATCHAQHIVAVDLLTGKAMEDSEPALSDSQFREEAARILGL